MDWSASGGSFRESSRLEPGGGRLHKGLEVQQSHRRAVEERLHPKVAHQRPKRATEHDAVEAAEHRSDKGTQTNYKFVHRVVHNPRAWSRPANRMTDEWQRARRK
jgi:hypothetical protein